MNSCCDGQGVNWNTNRYHSTNKNDKTSKSDSLEVKIFALRSLALVIFENLLNEVALDVLLYSSRPVPSLS